jgi:hypothetical protein
MFSELWLKRLVAAQPSQQRFSRVARIHVLDDDDGCGQVRGQLADQLIERFQPSCRRANHDDVSSL